MKIYLFFLVGGLIFLGTNAKAARSISLPYSTDFAVNDISDLVWTDCGATVTYISSGGYSGGAVKLTSPTSLCTGGGSNGGMGSIGDFVGFSTTRLNIRFLIKFGPTYVDSRRGAGNKFIDVHGNGSSDRFGILHLYKDGTFLAPAVTPLTSAWSVFRSPGTNDSDHDYANAAIQWSDAALNGEWYCFEYEINAAAGTATFTLTDTANHITTITTPMDETGTMDVFYIGGYHNGYAVLDVDNYIIIDNLAVSNTAIGPPEGFVGGEDIVPPFAPSGLSVN